MKNETKASRLFAALVTRAASLELRFINKSEFAKSLTIYADLIEGVNKPSSNTPPISMRLGNVQELRLVETAANSNCTVIYWAVLDNSDQGIQAACKALEANGCKTLEPIHSRPDQPGTECCLMHDPGGNLFGLIINPPVPFQ